MYNDPISIMFIMSKHILLSVYRQAKTGLGAMVPWIPWTRFPMIVGVMRN